MTVCRCNDISKEEILEAIASGRRTYIDVLDFYDKDPGCGCCRKYVEKRIKEYEENNPRPSENDS